MIPIQITNIYSHLHGHEYLQIHHQSLLDDISGAVSLDVAPFKTKVSEERNRRDELLLSPPAMNAAIYAALQTRGWYRHTMKLTRGNKYVDFLKQRVALEVQFGKYSFVDSDFTKHLSNFERDVIDVGIELLPDRSLTAQMSSGVACFEKAVSDLQLIRRNHPPVPLCVIAIGRSEGLKKGVEIAREVAIATVLA